MKGETSDYFFLKNGPTPASFLFIFVLFNNNFYRKIVDLSGIRTRIVGVEGEHADHLTTTTALQIDFYQGKFVSFNQV